MSSTVDTESALPPYSPPNVPATQTPSRATETDWTRAIEAAPVGVELIVRSLKPIEGTGSLVDHVKRAVQNVCNDTSALQSIPVEVTPGKSRGPPQPFCYVKLAAAVTKRADCPRPDLLDRYRAPLSQALGTDGWEIGWSPAHEKDKKFWVRLTPDQPGRPDSANDFVAAARSACAQIGAPTSGGWAMRASSKPNEPVTGIAVVAYNMAAKEKIISTPLPGFRHGDNVDIVLTASPWLQIEPDWPFELVVAGFGSLDYSMQGTLDQFFIDSFRLDENATHFHTSRIVAPDFYCFLMKDWSSTADVLKNSEAFVQAFGSLGLAAPMLIHTLNTHGLWKRKDNAESAIRTGTGVVSRDIQHMSSQIAQLRREMQAGYNELGTRMSAVEDGVKGITDNVRELSGVVYRNSQLLISQEKVQAQHALLQSTELRLVQLERKHDRAETEEEREGIMEEIRTKKRQLAKAEDELERMQDATRTLRGLPVPASTDVPRTPPCLPAPRRSPSPAETVIRTPTSTPHKRRTRDDRDEPPHMPRRLPAPTRRSPEQMDEDEEELVVIDEELMRSDDNTAPRNCA